MSYRNYFEFKFKKNIYTWKASALFKLINFISIINIIEIKTILLVLKSIT